jgi:hypothetical protein
MIHTQKTITLFVYILSIVVCCKSKIATVAIIWKEGGHIMAANAQTASNLPLRQSWNVGYTLGVIVFFIIIIALVGVLAPISWRLEVWIGTLVLLTAFLIILGRGITGQYLGFLIDKRNKMSLSRFQLGLWLLLLGSAFLIAALTNLHIVMFSVPVNALSITIPPELLALFGVSATSFAGASVILNAKTNVQQQKDSTVAQNHSPQVVQNQNPQVVQNHSPQIAYRVDQNHSPQDASWYDMFKGDDEANADYLDLSKVQMFFLTIILVLVYGVALGTMFMGVGDGVSPTTLTITAFPTLSTTMVTLLGISQVGYLAYKAVPRNSANP